jgi:hypothetical protein
MTRNGIRFPDVIDLTTKASDGTIRLVLAETEALTGHDIPALKRKLDNYAAFAQSGELPTVPIARGNRPVLIRVDLYAEPDQLVVIFLRHYRTLLEKQGLGLEVSLNQQDLTL